jgi:hypothetical protein
MQGGVHAEPLEKSLVEKQPAEVRQHGGCEDKAEFSRSSGHFWETSFLMRLNVFFVPLIVAFSKGINSTRLFAGSVITPDSGSIFPCFGRIARIN